MFSSAQQLQYMNGEDILDYVCGITIRWSTMLCALEMLQVSGTPAKFLEY
jgi:hypothetical protein